MFISIKRSNFTLAFSKAACHAYPGAERNFAGSNSYILSQTFLKFSNTQANNIVLHGVYKSWYYPKIVILKSLYNLLACA